MRADAVRPALGAAEHQRLTHRLLLQHVGQQVALARLGHGMHPVRDGAGHHLALRHVNAAGVVGEGGRQLHHFLREGRGEEQRLPLLRHGDQDALQRRQEAHVEHAIGFIQHEDLHRRQIHGALFHVIEQPAWRGDDDVGAALEGLLLRPDRDAAEDGGDAQVRGHAVGSQRLVHLQRQLAGGHEHQAARLARPGVAAAPHQQAVDHRQAERGRLAGAGLGARQQIASGQDDRNGLRLDRCGRGVTQLREWRTKGAGEPEGRKRHVLNVLSVAPARRSRAGKGRSSVDRKGAASPRRVTRRRFAA